MFQASQFFHKSVLLPAYSNTIPKHSTYMRLHICLYIVYVRPYRIINCFETKKYRILKSADHRIKKKIKKNNPCFQTTLLKANVSVRVTFQTKTQGPSRAGRDRS